MNFRTAFVAVTFATVALMADDNGHTAPTPSPMNTPVHSEQNFTVKRGFTVGLVDKTTLHDAKKWGANIVRIQLPLEYTARTFHLDWEQTWNKVLADLDSGLDVAKELNLTVVVTMPLMGADQYDHSLGRDENLAKFWDDDTSLVRLKERWRQIATICQKKGIVAWYDLLNEPLDRRDWPSAPKKWMAWSQALVDEIRQIDQKSWIVVESGPGGEMWEGLKHFPLLRDDKLIYSVHLYAPQRYTHQGVQDTQYPDLKSPIMELDKDWPGDYQDTWGNGRWDKERLEKLLEPVHEFSAKYPNILIYVGEFSVARWASHGEKYLGDCMEIFERYGWSWTYHALRESEIWSLEHDSTYSVTDPVLAVGPTERGKVVEEFLKLNALQSR